MVRQWQSLFFGKRYSNTTLNPVEGEQIPNFEMLAQAYGMAARTVRSIDEVDEAIEWAMSINDRPVLIDFRVSKDSMVWPMVAAGVSNDEIRYAKGMAPRLGGGRLMTNRHTRGRVGRKQARPCSLASPRFRPPCL